MNQLIEMIENPTTLKILIAGGFFTWYYMLKFMATKQYVRANFMSRDHNKDLIENIKALEKQINGLELKMSENNSKIKSDVREDMNEVVKPMNDKIDKIHDLVLSLLKPK